MYKEILRSINDIDIFPIIAIMIFFLFFIGLLIWVFKMDKKHVRHMSNMPLEDDKDLGHQNGKVDQKDMKLFYN